MYASRKPSMYRTSHRAMPSSVLGSEERRKSRAADAGEEDDPCYDTEDTDYFHRRTSMLLCHKYRVTGKECNLEHLSMFLVK